VDGGWRKATSLGENPGLRRASVAVQAIKPHEFMLKFWGCHGILWLSIPVAAAAHWQPSIITTKPFAAPSPLADRRLMRHSRDSRNLTRIPSGSPTSGSSLIIDPGFGLLRLHPEWRLDPIDDHILRSLSPLDFSHCAGPLSAVGLDGLAYRGSIWPASEFKAHPSASRYCARGLGVEMLSLSPL
jgi:hypothetical protein